MYSLHNLCVKECCADKQLRLWHKALQRYGARALVTWGRTVASTTCTFAGSAAEASVTERQVWLELSAKMAFRPLQRSMAHAWMVTEKPACCVQQTSQHCGAQRSTQSCQFCHWAELANVNQAIAIVHVWALCKQIQMLDEVCTATYDCL